MRLADNEDPPIVVLGGLQKKNALTADQVRTTTGREGNNHTGYKGQLW